MSNHCWTSRYEAMGYASAIDGAMRHDSGELLAIADRTGHRCRREEDGYCYCWIEVMDDTCMMAAGHAGRCRFERLA